MEPSEFFDIMFNYFNTKRNDWYKMFITPKHWGHVQGANVPMGHEFDIEFEITDNIPRIKVHVPDEFWNLEQHNVQDTCEPHGVGRVLPITSVKCIGHNHPMCALDIMEVETNELPTGTDINSVLNVARALGSAWSFVVSSVGLACYWVDERSADREPKVLSEGQGPDREFTPEEYDEIALQGLQQGDLSNALRYLNQNGINIKIYYWN